MSYGRRALTNVNAVAFGACDRGGRTQFCSSASGSCRTLDHAGLSSWTWLISRMQRGRKSDHRPERRERRHEGRDEPAPVVSAITCRLSPARRARLIPWKAGDLTGSRQSTDGRCASGQGAAPGVRHDVLQHRLRLHHDPLSHPHRHAPHLKTTMRISGEVSRKTPLPLQTGKAVMCDESHIEQK